MIKIYALTKPRPMWQVYYRHQGKAVRRHFPSLEAAEKHRDETAKIIQQVGTTGLHLDAAVRSDYHTARQTLDAAGWTDLTLAELARDFTERTKRLAAQSTPVAPLFEEFIRVKREDENKSKRWVETLQTRGSHWIESQGIATLQAITRESVLPLRSRPQVSARTRLADMTAVSAFLRWLVQEKWIQTNPLDGLPRPTADATAPRILRATQVQALLDAARTCSQGRLLRYFALAIYAGLRPSEIEALPEDRLRLTAKNPVVRVIGGKRRQRVRVVPVLPALAAWLKIAPKHQPIADLARRDRRLYDEVRQAAGLIKWAGQLMGARRLIFSHWQSDVLRHTFISLRMAMTQDEGRVALEAGNTPAVCHAHYLCMIDEREAKAMLAVRPK